MAGPGEQNNYPGLTVKGGRLYIDLDAPDALPLDSMLELIRTIRVRHEYERFQNVVYVAQRLGTSRYTIYRVLNRIGFGLPGKIPHKGPT
jgi:hypothetical protein